MADTTKVLMVCSADKSMPKPIICVDLSNVKIKLDTQMRFELCNLHERRGILLAGIAEVKVENHSHAVASGVINVVNVDSLDYVVSKVHGQGVIDQLFVFQENVDVVQNDVFILVHAQDVVIYVSKKDEKRELVTAFLNYNKMGY